MTAETVLYGMPVYPGESREWKPGKGRRLLCFSDSRREAARLGPLLTSQHETWVVRAAIADTLARFRPPSIAYIMRKIARSEQDADDLELTEPDRAKARREVEALRQQLAAAETGIGFTEFARSLGENPRIAEVLNREPRRKTYRPPAGNLEGEPKGGLLTCGSAACRRTGQATENRRVGGGRRPCGTVLSGSWPVIFAGRIQRRAVR